MVKRGLTAFGNEQVHRLRADEFDVGAGGIEVRVIGYDIALAAHHVEQNALRGPALVGGNDVTKAENVAHRVAQVIEAAAAGIAFVAFHNGGPLLRGHGAGSRIGQQVNEHGVSRELKQVVTG